jgi:hypothetical protein
MKVIYLSLALAAFGVVSAQKTIAVNDFKSLAVTGDIVLTLVQSSENKLVIAGEDDDSEDVIVSQQQGMLSISGDGKATLYYKNSFESLAAASDAVISGKDELKVKSLAIAAASDATVELKINVTSLNTAAASDAVITLSGSAKEHNAAVDSDAVLNAIDLKTVNATITANYDAVANVSVSGTVTATAKSDAVIQIHGNPSKVNQTATDEGSVQVVR